MKSSPYAAPEPYPEIKVEREDPRLANLIMGKLAGQQSEMTATTRYLYLHWTLTECHDVMFGIAKVEMHHMNMLGQMIRLLGGDPRFQVCQRGRPVFWNGGMIPYWKTVREALEGSMKAEEATAAGYQELIDQISDQNVCRVLARIRDDELFHQDLLREKLDALPEGC